MKTRLAFCFICILLGPCARAELPLLSIRLDGDEVVLEWEATPLNPGSSTELFYGYQVEECDDLMDWDDVGDPIAARVGGGNVSHSFRWPHGGAEFYRLRLNLDLAGQNLAGADLSGIDFGEAVLTGADLDGADLAGADLKDSLLPESGFSSIGGPVGRNIHDSLPMLPYRPNAAAFVSEGGAEGAGQVSTDTILVMPALGATTAEINALLATHGGQVVGGFGGDSVEEQPGMLIIRLAGGDAAAVVAALEGNPLVEVAVEDRYLYTGALPDLGTAGSPWSNWSATTPDSGGSWGYRLIRVPEMWNFNEALHKRGAGGGASPMVRVGMIDGGYHPTHAELAGILVPLDASAGAGGDPGGQLHGTGVASIIGAKHDSTGIAGVSPYVNIVGVGSDFPQGSTISGTTALALGEFYSDLVTRLLVDTRIRVINISMQGTHATDPAVTMPSWIVSAASMFRNIMVTRDGPIIVKAAGNFSYGAPWVDAVNYAALSTGLPNVFVVEALEGKSIGQESLATDWDGPGGAGTVGSNIGGNLSAPGLGIYGANAAPSGYRLWDGTSFAAPIVTGVIAYLYSLEPNLTKTQVVNIVNTYSLLVSGAAPRIDAFDCALAIDEAMGYSKVARMLLDIDDGTTDGNQRIRMLAKTDEEADPTTFDTEPFPEDDWGKLGDGVIDMADFRRFRDWTLIADSLLIGPAALRAGLDGPPEHPKNDPNRNRIPYPNDTRDAHYPRSDFNGDGETYREGRREQVGGIFELDSLNDVEVFGRLFVDEETGYGAADLPTLVDSSDLHLSFYWFMKWNETVAPQYRISQVRIRIESRIARTTRIYFHDVPEGPADRKAHFLITLPGLDQYRVYVCGDTGEFFGEVGENKLLDFDGTFGRDLWFAPRLILNETSCEPEDP